MQLERLLVTWRNATQTFKGGHPKRRFSAQQAVNYGSQANYAKKKLSKENFFALTMVATLIRPMTSSKGSCHPTPTLKNRIKIVVFMYIPLQEQWQTSRTKEERATPWTAAARGNGANSQSRLQTLLNISCSSRLVWVQTTTPWPIPWAEAPIHTNTQRCPQMLPSCTLLSSLAPVFASLEGKSLHGYAGAAGMYALRTRVTGNPKEYLAV